MTKAQKETLLAHQRTMAKRSIDFSQQARADSTEADIRAECLAGAMHSQLVADAIGVALRENGELIALASSMVERPSEQLLTDLYAAINNFRRSIREREERLSGAVESDEEPTE